MTLKGLTIIVIGAGIGGLAAARAMALRGARVTVLEQAPEISEVGAGLQLSPNAMAVIRALGLDEPLEKQAVAGRAVELCDYRGAPVLRLDLSQTSGAGHGGHGPDYRFVHRADLIDVLAQGARAAGVRIRLLQKVSKVEPGRPPRVHLANGASMTADVVVGADGLHSHARHALNGAQAPFFTGQVAWRAVVPNGDGFAPVVRVHMGPHRHLVSYPLRQGHQLNIVAVQERAAWAAESWSQQDDPMALRAAFADFCPEVQQMLARIEQVHLWGLFRHPVAQIWQGGGVALLGDAAHPTLPFMAQGAAMALEDAWVLSEALSSAPTADDLAARLVTYQTRREGRARRVVAAATGNAWKYHLSFPPLRMAAHGALRLAGRVAPGAMLRQFDWLYGHDVTAAATQASA